MKFRLPHLWGDNLIPMELLKRNIFNKNTFTSNIGF